MKKSTKQSLINGLVVIGSLGLAIGVAATILFWHVWFPPAQGYIKISRIGTEGERLYGTILITATRNQLPISKLQIAKDDPRDEFLVAVDAENMYSVIPQASEGGPHTTWGVSHDLHCVKDGETQPGCEYLATVPQRFTVHPDSTVVVAFATR